MMVKVAKTGQARQNRSYLISRVNNRVLNTRGSGKKVFHMALASTRILSVTSTSAIGKTGSNTVQATFFSGTKSFSKKPRSGRQASETSYVEHGEMTK